MKTAANSTSAPWPRKHAPMLLIALLASVALGAGAFLFTRKTPEDHLALAKSYAESGDIKSAVIEYKTVVQAMPANAEVRYQLAKVLYSANDFAGAEKELSKAREFGLNQPEASVLLGRCLLSLGKPEQVLSDLQPIPNASAEINATLHALRAQAHYMRDEPAAMLDALADAERSYLDHPETILVRALHARSQENLELAMSLTESGLAKNPAHPDLWLLKGDLLKAGNHGDQSRQAYEKVLQLAPGNISARIEIVQWHIKSKALEKADAELNILKSRSPGNPNVILLGAILDSARQQYAEALSKAQTILRNMPTNLTARLLAADASLKLGKLEESQNHLKPVLDAQPNNAQAKRLMALAMLQSGQLDQARSMVASIPIATDEPMMDVLRAEIALRQGDYQEASRWFESAIASGTVYPKLLMGLAASQEAMGNLNAAIESMEKAASFSKDSFEADSQLIAMLIRNKRFAEAQKVVDRMAAKHPKAGLLDNLRGVIEVASGNLRQARAHFEKALKDNPVLLEAASSLANLDVAAKDYKAAKGRYEAVLAKAPNNVEAMLGLAKLAALQKNGPEFRTQLEKAKRTDGKNIEARELLVHYWLGMKNPSMALTEAREGLTATGNGLFQELTGMAYMHMGDSKAALDAFQRWAHDNPHSPQALSRLALALADTGDRKGAMQLVDRALSIQPRFFDAMVLKMTLLGLEGKSADAVKIARDLQVKYPNQALGFTGEASVLEATKRYGEAAILFAKAAQLANQPHLVTRAAKNHELAGNAQQGITLLNQWLQARPGELGIRHELAQILLNTKRYDEAIQQYRHLLQANAQDVIALNNLALAMVISAKRGAAEVAEQAYKLSPDAPDIQDTLGWALLHEGQSQRGIKLIKQAHDKHPENMEFHWHYAKGLALMGEPVLARHELETFLVKGKNSPWGEEARKLLESLKR